MTAAPAAHSAAAVPSPNAIGIMPMIMAKAVMRTGRSRVNPACSAASNALSPAFMRSRAKLTTNTLFAVATPCIRLRRSGPAR